MAKKNIHKVKKVKKDFFVHPSATVEEDVQIGKGSKIWHLAQVRHGSKIGQDCVIARNVFIDFDSQIGNNVKIQNHAIVYHQAIIEDGVFVGPNVCFTNDRLPRAINPDGTLKSADDWEVSKIQIKKGASIGGHSVLTPGVTIGKFALIGAGSVVSKDVPDFALIYGNPAKIKGFVCRCGKKIKSFFKKRDFVEGKCDCSLTVEIDKKAYQILSDNGPKKVIWLR